MSFGAGIAAGMGAGMGSGIAIGISSGRQQARKDLISYLDSEGMTIHDRSGKELKLDAVLDQAFATTACCQQRTAKTVRVIALLAGIAALGAAIYVLLRLA